VTGSDMLSGGPAGSPAGRWREGCQDGPVQMPRVVLLDANEGCLTLARRVAARGVEVVALCPPRARWIARSRALRGIPVGPLPDSSAEWLAEVTGLADGPGVLISGSDAATEWLVEHRDRIPAALASFEGGTSAHLRLMDKAGLLELAREVGVRAPWTHRVDTRADLDALVSRELPLPCVAKPVMGHVARRVGDFATRGIPDVDTLVAHVGAALDLGMPMMVTEQIPGSATALEGAVTLRGADGQVALEYGRRKIRQYPVDYGVVALMELVPAPEALATARRLLDGAGYVGLASTEFKRHAVTGELVLIEVNVRVPQSFGLAQAGGTDGPWRVYATLAGLELGPQPPACPGAKVWIPQLDLHAVRELRRRGDTSLSDVVRSLRHVRDHGPFSWRDPGPGLAVAGAEARGFLRNWREHHPIGRQPVGRGA
jgi:D-aspartate ligase